MADTATPDNDPIVSYNAPGAPAGGAVSDQDDPVVSYSAPQAPQRSGLAEVGTGFARGALYDLPVMAGQALQFAGASQTGQAVRNWGQGMGQQSWLTLNPEAHGSVVNALASGAEQVAPILAPVGAAALGIAALPAELPALATLGVSAAAGGALAAGAAGQQTLEKAQAKGLTPEAAQSASRLNAATTFAAQVGLGMVGGRVLGAAGNAIGRAVGADGAPLASSILTQLTGQGGIVGPTLKAAATGGAEAVALGGAQAAASAAIEQHYGVDDTSPLSAAMQTIPTMLGLTAVLTPFGLAGRALGARAAANKTAILAHPESDPALRQQYADQYTQALAAPGTPEAAQAAENFRQNAQTAIDNKRALPINAGVLDAGAVTLPKTPAQAAADVTALQTADAVRPATGLTPQEVIDQQTGVQPAQTEAQTAARQADATAAYNEPSGVRVNDPATGIERELPMGELMEMQAAGNLPPPSATPKAARAANENVDALHTQVQQELTAAGVEPAQPMTRQEFSEANNATGQAAATAYRDYLADPATQDALLQENVSKYANTPEAQTNTQLGDSLQTAIRQQQIDRAYAQVAAQREAETNAIANRTQGEALVNAAERGEVQPDANAPKTRDNISMDVDAVNQANDFDTKAQSMVPFNKRLDSLGLDSMPDHAAQIDTLQTYLANRDVKMSDGVRDRMTALLTQWKAEQPEPTPEAPAPEAGITAAPPPAEGLPTNIPPAAPDNAPPPAQSEVLGENVTQSAQSHAQESADMVDASLAQFNQRIRDGEQLTPLEQERMEDLQGFRNSLSEVTSGANTSDDYAQSISDMAREAAQAPYKQSYRRYEVGDPEALDPGIMFDSLRTGRLQDTLNTIAQNGSTPEVKALADRLSKLDTGTTLKYAAPDGTGSVGEYQPATNHVNIFPGGESEQTILHESIHAAQQAQVARAEAITTPRTQDEARLKSAYNEIEAIRTQVQQSTGSDAYGLTNAHEFLAELNTNPAFQQILKDASTQGKPSLWTQTVNAVRKLLGMPASGGDYLARAMGANEAFFREPGPDTAGFPLPDNSPSFQRFIKTPQDAATVTDEQYSKMAGLAVKLPPVNVDRLSLASYRTMLPTVTKQYIADRIRAIPEMVQSGFAAGVDAHLANDAARRVVTSLIEGPVTHYADRVNKMLNGLKDSDKRRDLEKQMMLIGGEASIGGFDYKLNYADNVKAGRALDPASKGYVDDIHRQYTQMQRTNPEAAKAIDDGALQNRRTLVMKAATVMRNLIDSTQNADMLKHAPLLDLTDPALKTARNTDTARFPDGMSAALHSRLQAAFSDATANLPQGSVLRDGINELRDMYNAQIENPYFSLGRDGDYFVKVGFQNMDAQTQAKLQGALAGTNKVLGNLLGGQDHAFFRVDTLDQAVGLYNKLLQAGGDKIDGAASARGKLADRVDSAQGVSPALRSLLGNLHETVDRTGLTGDTAAAVRDTITRQLLSMLPETSARSAMMQRRGVPGYDGDFLSNFAKRASGGVQDTANMHAQPAYAAARQMMDQAITQMNRTAPAELATRAQMAADEINTRYANSQKPFDNKVVNLINSLGHTFYLAASPAYLIRTTAQPFHRGVPIMGSRYGFVNASRAVAGATGTAMNVIKNTIADGYSEAGMRGVLDANASFRDIGLPANEQAFVQELHDRGVLNLGQARQLQSMAMGGKQWQQDVARMASMTAQYAEMTNRLVTGLAAFRLAEKAKPGDAANTEWAIQTIDRAMDNFDPTNTARVIGKYGFAKGATPLLTAFMNYNLQTMQQIARTVHDGLFNRDPSAEGLQRAKEARKEFAGLMGTTAMISGAMGLPFANVFAGLYNTFTNDNNDPRDIRIDTQNWLSRTFGHTAGEILSHGLPRAVGFDSSTFGLENLLPGSEFLSSRQLLKDRLGDQSTALMGPALNAGIGIVEAMDKFSDGYYVKGIEAALPSGLKPYFKAVELASRGYTDSKGNPIGIDATPWDIGLQAVGFKSAKAATQSENAQFAGAREDRQKFQRGLIEDQLYKGVTTGNQDLVQQAVGGITRFNMANPTQPMADVQSGIEQRLSGLALARITGTGVALTPKQLPSLARLLLTAQEPQTNGFGVGFGMP